MDDHVFTLSPTYKKQRKRTGNGARLQKNLNSPLVKYLLQEEPTSKIPQYLQTVSADSTLFYWGIFVTQSISTPYK